jgi:hypothetical protein
MDNRLRRNDVCIIGLPSCGFAFASNRSCFIAYGFDASTLEKAILKNILERRGVEALEAGGMRTPGESAFCAKICSKIITSQFCIAIVNHDLVDGQQVPNANVNMEYGLMLGLNKYVIPFQREDHDLPFNVAGLDTIKYTTENFERLATEAIDQAILRTRPSGPAVPDPNERIVAFLLTHDLYVVPLDDAGHKVIYELGAPLGFNLLGTFAGTDFVYLGNFTAFRAEAVIWRVRTLERLINGRRSSFDMRVQLTVMTAEQATLLSDLFDRFRVWVLVQTEAERDEVRAAFTTTPIQFAVSVFAVSDLEARLRATNEGGF